MAKITATTHLVKTEPDTQGRRAAPGECHVRAGDSVRFQNGTKDTIKINFSHDQLFATARTDVATGKEVKLEVQDVRPGGYPYSIFCTDIGDFAHGSAMPIIIVEPKDT